MADSQLLAFAFADMKGIAGFNGWRWYVHSHQSGPEQLSLTWTRIFIGEGLITVVASAIAFWFIAPWPENAKWLTPEEKRMIVLRNQEGVRAAKLDRINWRIFLHIARDWKIWLGYALLSIASSWFLL